MQVLWETRLCLPSSWFALEYQVPALNVVGQPMGFGIIFLETHILYIWCCSVAKSCPTLCDPMYCSTPGFPVPHYLQEFAQIHVHWVMDATPFSSCPQSFPTSGSFPVSWLFTSGDQNIGASEAVLPMNIQGWLPLGLTRLISLLSEGFSKFFSSTVIQKH